MILDVKSKVCLSVCLMLCLRSYHLGCGRVIPPRPAVTGLMVCGAAATGSTAGDRRVL